MSQIKSASEVLDFHDKSLKFGKLLVHYQIPHTVVEQTIVLGYMTNCDEDLLRQIQIEAAK